MRQELDVRGKGLGWGSRVGHSPLLGDTQNSTSTFPTCSPEMKKVSFERMKKGPEISLHTQKYHTLPPSSVISPPQSPASRCSNILKSHPTASHAAPRQRLTTHNLPRSMWVECDTQISGGKAKTETDLEDEIFQEEREMICCMMLY